MVRPTDPAANSAIMTGFSRPPRANTPPAGTDSTCLQRLHAAVAAWRSVLFPCRAAHPDGRRVGTPVTDCP